MDLFDCSQILYYYCRCVRLKIVLVEWEVFQDLASYTDAID